jgi:undecaprenyl diphosphate synthase
MLKELLAFKKLAKVQNEKPHFSQEELRSLDFSLIPKHVAIVPDGNRRWAMKNNIFSEEGHRAGADSILRIIRASRELSIEILSFYIFSTENWLRPPQEINAIMRLLEKLLIEQRQNMLDNGVKFLTIGDLSKFPSSIIKLVEETKKATTHCKEITVVFAMNYGSRDELRRAFTKILEDYSKGKISAQHISESLISNYLDTSNWKDPDLFIRTGGEYRISNFLLWQISYSELYTTNVYWPEFTPIHLLEAVREFQKRDRRLGA